MRHNLAALPDLDDRTVTPPSTELTRLWRVSDLSRYWSVSRPMVYKLIANGDLDSIKIGNQIRIPERSAIEYLRRRGGAE